MWGSRGVGLGACAAAAVTLASVPAQATNGATARTPPIFHLEQCRTVVDRTVDPMFHLDFAIPYPDENLTADELDDSRRFQFFAACRDHHPGELLPLWVSADDVQRALEAELIGEPPPASDVLDTSEAWAGCLHRVNADDERIPITCEDTQGAIDWDTTEVPAGNYVIHGYTFEPEISKWVSRRGVVQVTDGEEPPPVVSLMSPAQDAKVYERDGYVVMGCMGGPPGTTVALSYARISDLEVDEPQDWTEFAVLDAAQGTFEVCLQPRPQDVNQALVMRGVAEASGESWIAYAQANAIIYPGAGQSDPPEVTAGPDFCEVYPETPPDVQLTNVCDAASGEETSGEMDDTSGGGCGCVGGRTTGAPAGAVCLMCVALCAIRRRFA